MGVERWFDLTGNYNMKFFYFVNVLCTDLIVKNRHTGAMTEKTGPPLIPQILARNLTRLRKRAGYKQTEFAKLCDMSKQRLWYYEHAYKGRVLPAEVAIEVSRVLERAGLGLEEIASISLLPETSEITLPPPPVPDQSSEQILEVLQDVRSLLLEIRDSGRKTWEGRPPPKDQGTAEDDRD